MSWAQDLKRKCDGHGQDPPRVGKSDPVLSALHKGIILDMTYMVSAAMKQLRTFAEGTMADWEATQIRLMTNLARLAPQVLPIIEQEREASIASFPECIICEGVHGEHWAHDCPSINHEEHRERYVFDYKTRRAYERSELGTPVPALFSICPWAPGTIAFEDWWKEHGHKHYSEDDKRKWEAQAAAEEVEPADSG
jgi:hypothetical protein